MQNHEARPVLLPVMIILCLLAAVSACTGTPEGNPDRGQRWYHLYRCNGCHGEDGTGGRGPDLAPTSLSFSKFLNKLRSPDSSVMPAYGSDRVSHQDAADIYLWLIRRQETDGTQN